MITAVHGSGLRTPADNLTVLAVVAAAVGYAEAPANEGLLKWAPSTSGGTRLRKALLCDDHLVTEKTDGLMSPTPEN